MSGGGLWIDMLLGLLLLVALGALYLLENNGGWFSGTRTPRIEGDLGRRLRGYYPTLARQAGLDPARFRWPYWACKVGLAVLLPLLFLEMLNGSAAFSLWWPSVVIMALLGFLGVDLWLWLRRRRRRERIRRALSYFLDLLVSLLRSGLGVEEAFRRAGREGFEGPHPLAQEVRLVAEELDVGKERSIAFQAMADRTGVQELRGVAAALGMGSRLGTSVETTLRAQADLLRAKRREAALRRISTAAIKTLLPVFLCGFPILFVLAFFPAIVELVETLKLFQGIWY